jgi:exonuclease III
MATAWNSGPALLVGDTNCGKRGIDEEKPSPPKFWREHDWIVGLEQRGWLDAFRCLHGDRREYTWYSHRNNGFRLDYAFGSPHLAPAITAVQHLWGYDSDRPNRHDGLSDHAALIVDVDGRLVFSRLPNNPKT